MSGEAIASIVAAENLPKMAFRLRAPPIIGACGREIVARRERSLSKYRAALPERPANRGRNVINGRASRIALAIAAHAA